MRKLQKSKGGQLDFLHLVEELTLKLSREELEFFFFCASLAHIDTAQCSYLWWSDTGPISASKESW